MPESLCPHDRLAAHCMWCLAETLQDESEALRRLDKTLAHQAAQAVVFPAVQARAARLYGAYVAGLGPLGADLLPWEELIDRQQFAWRCVVRAAQEEEAP